MLDQAGQDINALANATYAMVGAGQPVAEAARPVQLVHGQRPAAAASQIDRERALALGLPISEITSAMQIYLGSQYVNDFDFNNRAYRVYVQADQAFRSDPTALEQFYVAQHRAADGAARERRARRARRRRRR